jgi:hypothetical protein
MLRLVDGGNAPGLLEERPVRQHSSGMGYPNVPEALALAVTRGVTIDEYDLTYFLGLETILVTRRKGMAMSRAAVCRHGTQCGQGHSVPPPAAGARCRVPELRSKCNAQEQLSPIERSPVAVPRWTTGAAVGHRSSGIERDA